MKGRVELHELLTFLLTILFPVAGVDGSMYLTPDVHTVVGTQWDVTRVALTTPELDEGQCSSARVIVGGRRWRKPAPASDLSDGSTMFGFGGAEGSSTFSARSPRRCLCWYPIRREFR